ncbi:hypothetical protein RI367_006574 [Sorochytrium milnesiophthora]
MSPGMPTPSASPFAALVPSQHYAVVDKFETESGVRLVNVPVAYCSFGSLNAVSRDNVVVVCHAVSGSANVKDWWAPLLSQRRGKAPTSGVLDTSKFFVVSFNVAGSPYGSISPLHYVSDHCADRQHDERRFGPDFPLFSVRDDVRLHRQVLRQLGVKQVQYVIGGSIGGMHALEWACLDTLDPSFAEEADAPFIRHFIPIATTARFSGWCIAWSETQRQTIFADPKYCDGRYPLDDPPNMGLALARAQALLTYRTPSSFNARFNRNLARITPAAQQQSSRQRIASPRSQEYFAEHNHNSHYGSTLRSLNQPSSSTSTVPTESTVFSAQSYIHYQGEKFVARFDANCYITLTRKMDTHDIGRGRAGILSAGHRGTTTGKAADATTSDEDTPHGCGFDSDEQVMWRMLQAIQRPALVIGVDTDMLFPIDEQKAIADHLPHGELAVVSSGDGHDGFLLEFDQVNGHLLNFMRKMTPEYFADDDNDDNSDASHSAEEQAEPYSSVFGEAEGELVF